MNKILYQNHSDFYVYKDFQEIYNGTLSSLL